MANFIAPFLRVPDTVASFSVERRRLPLRPPQVVADTSAIVWSPTEDAGRFGVVLAHGAGSDLSHPLLLGVGRGLADRGYPVLAFNFAYAEAGRRRPDPASRCEAAFRDAISEARAAMDGRPLVLGGRSFGGRIASHVAAAGTDCAGLALLGYPLHPRLPAAERGRSRPERLRTAHWPALRVPTLFVQGERDGLCDLDVLDRERATRLVDAPSEVHVVAGGDHSFTLRKRDVRSAAMVTAEIVAVVGDWLDRLPTGHPAA